MSKERLEEIKKHRNDADNSTDEYEFEKINFYNLHVDWLIEQAERVQELEEDLLELVKQNKELRKSIAFYSSESYNAHLERLLDRSEKQIKRYREAIEEAIEKLTWNSVESEKILLKALEGEE